MLLRDTTDINQSQRSHRDVTHLSSLLTRAKALADSISHLKEKKNVSKKHGEQEQKEMGLLQTEVPLWVGETAQ